MSRHKLPITLYKCATSSELPLNIRDMFYSCAISSELPSIISTELHTVLIDIEALNQKKIGNKDNEPPMVFTLAGKETAKK